MTKKAEALPNGIEIAGPIPQAARQVLTLPALNFLAKLEREFRPRRKVLLEAREKIQNKINQGEYPTFQEGNEAIQSTVWKVSATPTDLENRRVEITGPTDRKMIINAMNSGANVFMADFEDANSPTWRNMLEGQQNIIDAVRRNIDYLSPDGRKYRLDENPAVLMVRPRGWHLEEKHLYVDGKAISGSLFDFGLFFFHNAQELISRGTSPYFYLAKLENHLEARLWNDVFSLAQSELGIPHGTIRATVLIENILAAFEMEEILFELKEHAAGLNAGRWDYIFSTIKKFNQQTGFVFPDRIQITMTVPFMRAYTELLVKTCHKHGAHAIGGMAAFIPSRRDSQINEIALAKVREDKIRESADGFDGTWVAHPDLVPLAKAVFDDRLGNKLNQKEFLRNEVQVTPAELLNFIVPGGTITESGLRNNISVAIQYLSSWLAGRGAVGIFNLMEDTATAEISRSQIWQWLHQPEARLDNGLEISPELYLRLLNEELIKIKAEFAENVEIYQFDLARDLLDQLVLSPEFVGFLTQIGYAYLD